MATIRLYHNPRCSKSRQALEQLRNKGYEPIIINYMVQKITLSTLKGLLNKLNCPALDLVRTNEAAFDSLDPDNATEEQLLQEIIEQPVLLQRPIVVCNNRAVIARPADKLWEIIDD